MLLFHNIGRQKPVRHCTNYPMNRPAAATARRHIIENIIDYSILGRKKTLSRDY
jgi:hypothetical protein